MSTSTPPPFFSVVFTLDRDPALRQQALRALRERPELTCGELSGDWLPAAGEGRFAEAEWRGLPGVRAVELVMIRQEADGAIRPILPSD